MTCRVRRATSSAFTLWIALLGSQLAAHPDLSVTLEKFAERIKKNPQAYEERANRAWLMLEHGNSGDTAQADIDTLLSHSQWRGQGLRLKAHHLFLLGRLEEAKILAAENLKGQKTNGPEQPRLLARIELVRGDTGAAIQAYQLAWEKHREETDFIELLGLYRARGHAPAALLKQGWARLPRSPGAAEAIFTTYFAVGDKLNLTRSLEISTRAQSYWPRSVDWKIRHAKALLGTGKARQAETSLLQAMDLLDESSRLDPNAKSTLDIRKEIFALIEASRAKASTSK